MKVTGRSCREWTMDLISLHRKDEIESAIESRITEEAASEMDILLISISKLEAEKEQPTKLKTLHSKAGRAEAEKIREDALEDMDQVNGDEQEAPAPINIQVEDNQSDDKRELETPKRARWSNGKRELVSFLEKKSELELQVRKDEIRIREREADNKRLELEILRSKTDAEIEERKKMTALLLQMVTKSRQE